MAHIRSDYAARELWTAIPRGLAGISPRSSNRRGRDDHRCAPPAQIRTGAFTHTALTVDEWRRNVLLAAHRAIPGTCASRSVSDACVIERCSPQSVPFPPQPPRKVALPCSAGSQVVRHSPTSPARTCPHCGLWPSRTGLDLLTKTCRRSPGSRACCFSCRCLFERWTERSGEAVCRKGLGDAGFPCGAFIVLVRYRAAPRRDPSGHTRHA